MSLCYISLLFLSSPSPRKVDFRHFPQFELNRGHCLVQRMLYMGNTVFELMTQKINQMLNIKYARLFCANTPFILN